MGYKKRERKDGMPKKHNPKNKGHMKVPVLKKQILDTWRSKKKKNIYNIIAMSLCYPNKRERDP